MAIDDYDSLIQEAAQKYNLDPRFGKAVMSTESSGDPNAIGDWVHPKTGQPWQAKGLMQLSPDTATKYGVKNVFNPGASIDAGMHYLSDLLNQHNGDVNATLAAYGGAAKDPDAAAAYQKKVWTAYKGVKLASAASVPSAASSAAPTRAPATSTPEPQPGAASQLQNLPPDLAHFFQQAKQGAPAPATAPATVQPPGQPTSGQSAQSKLAARAPDLAQHLDQIQPTDSTPPPPAPSMTMGQTLHELRQDAEQFGRATWGGFRTAATGDYRNLLLNAANAIAGSYPETAANLRAGAQASTLNPATTTDPNVALSPENKLAMQAHPNVSNYGAFLGHAGASLPALAATEGITTLGGTAATALGIYRYAKSLGFTGMMADAGAWLAKTASEGGPFAAKALNFLRTAIPESARVGTAGGVEGTLVGDPNQTAGQRFVTSAVPAATVGLGVGGVTSMFGANAPGIEEPVRDAIMTARGAGVPVGIENIPRVGAAAEAAGAPATVAQARAATRAWTRYLGQDVTDLGPAETDRMMGNLGRNVGYAARLGQINRQDIDPVIQQIRADYGGAPGVPQSAHFAQIQRLLNEVERRFDPQTGIMSGADFQNLIQHGSDIDRAARGQMVEIAEPAERLMRALDHGFENGSSPEVLREYQEARGKYKMGVALEDNVKSSGVQNNTLVNPKTFYGTLLKYLPDIQHLGAGRGQPAIQNMVNLARSMKTLTGGESQIPAKGAQSGRLMNQLLATVVGGGSAAEIYHLIQSGQLTWQNLPNYLLAAGTIGLLGGARSAGTMFQRSPMFVPRLTTRVPRPNIIPRMIGGAVGANPPTIPPEMANKLMPGNR